MEAENNSPEDASSMSVPLVKSIKNIGNEEIIFPQKLGTEVNSEYPLVEEKGIADSKTDEVSEIRPQEIHQESCEVCVGSEKQAEVPSDWLKQRDSEGLVMTESIPKSSEHEHEPMSTIPELAINHSEMAEKICKEETYNEEEESTEIDNDKRCRPENDLGKRSKALEAIDQTQFMGKDTAVNEHADHQSEAPSMENVITKHSNLEEKLLAESSIKSNYEEEPLQKILELYSVDNSEIKIDGKVMPEKARGVPADGTLRTLSTTECIGAEELEKKDEGKFAHEKAKEMEAATEMQLLESASADSPPENKDKSAVSTSEFVKGHTDEISQQQTHKNDETAVIDTGKSSAEPEGDEKLDKEAKAIEEAITQLLNTETESPPEEEVQTRLPTPDIVQQETDQIIKQQPLNQDQPDVIDNAKSCIAEKELDRVSTVIEEPVQLETKDNISIVKEQADQQSEETSMQSVTTNYIIEGHVISESTTKLTDDVHESHSIKNLERKDTNEIREEATDVKQSIRKTEAKGISEDKALQTLFSAELVGSKTVEERCQEDIKPEAQLAVTYANEEKTPQHEFDTKKEIPEEEACQLTAENEPKSEPQIVAQNNETTYIKHPYLNGETAEINPTSDTVEQEITMSHTKEKLAIQDDKKFNLEEVQGTVKETKMQLQDTTTESVSKEEPIQPIAIAGSAHDESSSEEIQPEANVTEKSNKEVQTSHVTEKEGIWDNGNCSQVEEAKTIEEPTKMQLQEEEVQKRSPTPASVEGDTNLIWQQEALYIDESEVNDNAKQGYIPKIAQDIKLNIDQETEKPETMDNVGIVTEKLDNKDVSDIRLQKGTDAKQLTDVEIPKSETEGVPEDEVMQPISNAVQVRIEAVEESKQELQPKADATDKSNREVLIKKFVSEETAEINTNNYTEEQDTVQTSHANEQEGTVDDEKLHEEAKGIEEKTKTQFPEEEFQTTSPIPAFIQGDSGQTSQQETLNIDESEVLDNDKQSCIPEIELDGKSTVVQETNNPETKDNVSTGEDNLENKDEIEVREEEGTCVEQLPNVEIPKSETKGVPKDEPLQPIANIVLVRTEAVDEGSQQGIQTQADVTQKSNKDVKTPEYVTAETIEKNTTNYNMEQEKVPSTPAKDEGIKNKFNHKEEAKGIEEATKIQSLEEEVQTKSPTPILIQGDNNQVPYQETLAVDRSEVIDNAKQSCITEIELDGGNSIVVQETEKPETKNNVNIRTRNFEDKDASEIRAEEGSHDKQVTEVERSKSLTEDLPEYEDPTEIAITVVVGAETVNDSNQEQIQLDDGTEKKSNKEEQTPKYAADDTAQINTNNYPDEHDKDQTSHAKTKEGIDEEILDQMTKAKATVQSSKMHLPQEEIQTTSLTPTVVQGNTEQISQHELLHVDESEETIGYVKQSCIPEIELQRRFTIAQETEKPESNDSISKITENSATNDATKIRAEEETEEDQVRQPIVIVTERVDDTKEEQIQLDEDITEKKSNEEEQTTQYVAEDTAEIHTTSYIDQHDKVQTSDAEVKQGIEDDENFGPQVEDQAIAESSKMKLPKEEVQTRSPSPGFVQHDPDKILQQELLELDQSEVIDYVMQSCIPEIELDRKSIIAQETEKTETEDNISNVTENLGTNYESKVREEEETDFKKFVDLKMPKSEITEDELLQTITIAVVVGTETVDDSNQEQMRLEEDITEKKSNREEQTPQHVAEDTAEINTNNYTNEHDKVQTSDAEVKQRIEDDEKFGQQEETKGIEETRKIQLLETRSPTTAFVQGNSDQILQQELLHVDESEVIDYMKQSSLPEIQLDRKSTVVQETEKLNTKDNVGIVTEKLGTTDARKIRAELADFMMPKSEIEEVPEDQVPQPIAVAVAIRTEIIDDINKKQIQQLKEDITDKKSNKEQSPQYVVENTAEINTNSYTDGHDNVQTSHAEVNKGIEGFGQEEEASGLEERNKRQLPKEERQITSPTPAFVQGDTAQISQQELLHIDESEVIDYVKQSCIQEIELDRKSTTFQETEKPEAKDNVGIVTENLGTNDASEIKEKEETDAENLADLKMAESEIEVIASQEKRQPQQEFVKKFNKEEQKPQYFTEDSAKIETTNDTEEQEEVPPSQPSKEKSGIKDDGKLEEEKGIEEATKTQLQDKDSRTTLPIHTLIQGHFDQILQQQTLHDDESKGISNAKKSCTQEMKLDRESIIVEEPETKDNLNIVKQEQANNQSEKSSIQRGITHNITAEGLVTLESNREISDDVCTDEQKMVKSCSTENLDNKNASEISVENSSEAKPSTYVEIIESKSQGEPEDKALQTRLNSSSIGNEGLDESSPEVRQTEVEFIENFNKDVQTPQRDTKVTAETNTATYPDKQQEAPASDANEKLGIQDEGKFDQEEAEGIEESIEKQLPEEEIQYTLPTPTSVQGDIDKMSQQQTLHDNEIEAINNAQSCMTEFELDRKSIVVEEPKPETKANIDLVKEEQADHQSEESSVQSFITNYLIVERHMISESNKESSDDVDLHGHNKEESHLVEFLQIKDASEIRAKGMHTNQLTDIEIQKSETEGVAEDKGMQTMSSTTSGKNYASNECCQEEIQPQEEYVETHIKEVKTPYYEFDMQNQIPEAFGVQEDACQIMVENEQKLKSQLAPPNKETTFIDNLYSDGEIAKTNPINDIEKVVNPKSRTMEKSVIHDDSKFSEEKAKGIEEMTKIKLLDTATDSPQKEVQPKLPAPATVQGDTDQILQHQTLPGDASGIIDNDMRCIPENKLDRMSTVIEEPEINANINIVEEEQSDKQSQEPSMQSLITEYITEEGHLASESNSKLSYDMNAQKTVNLQVVENLGIKYGSKMTVEEVTDARLPTGVEVEKTKNEGVLDFKAKTLTNAELVEHETLDETNQETQPEEEFSGTYSKGKQTPQSSMENVITKHINSEGKEITESSTKSSYVEEEQEQVINTYTIENSEIKDGRKIVLEEASDIKEATDEPVDRAISIIQMEVQPAVINTKEDQRPENDFVRNTEILEEFDLKKVSGNTCVENEEKVEVQSEANNQKTIKKHPNLEELETAEISPSSDTKELGKEREVAKLGGVSESVSVDITEHIDMGKLETQETENANSGNTKEEKAGDEFEKISPSSSVDVISRDSQDTGTKVLHKKSNGILSGVGSKVKHSISKVKKVITGKSSRPKTPPSSK